MRKLEKIYLKSSSVEQESTFTSIFTEDKELEIGIHAASEKLGNNGHSCTLTVTGKSKEEQLFVAEAEYAAFFDGEMEEKNAVLVIAPYVSSYIQDILVQMGLHTVRLPEISSIFPGAGK